MQNSELRNISTLIATPVFNDWEAVYLLLIDLDKYLDNANLNAEVLIVDDASIIGINERLISENLRAITNVKILELRRNIGHQRAIAIALAYIEENLSHEAVLVMDGDGEDDPKDVVRLIEECYTQSYEKVIFARRNKRSENWQFKLFYLVYQSLYKLLTGQNIRVGNFSIIPRKILKRLVVVSELWNHYAVALLKAKVPYTEIYSKRATRLAGKPKMNFVSLVTHGLSAISVYGDIVGVRLLVASAYVILFSIMSIAIVIFIRLTTNLAIPGWASYIVIMFFILLLQAVMLSLFFSFLILSGRNSSSFLPKRDYHYFIMELRQVFPKI